MHANTECNRNLSVVSPIFCFQGKKPRVRAIECEAPGSTGASPPTPRTPQAAAPPTVQDLVKHALGRPALDLLVRQLQLLVREPAQDLAGSGAAEERVRWGRSSSTAQHSQGRKREGRNGGRQLGWPLATKSTGSRDGVRNKREDQWSLVTGLRVIEL
jgi:hypothetical protein